MEVEGWQSRKTSVAVGRFRGYKRRSSIQNTCRVRQGAKRMGSNGIEGFVYGGESG